MTGGTDTGNCVPGTKERESKFNKAFLALHKKYKGERPEMFQENDWPVVIADEVSKGMLVR